ncbi:hypothetical protein OUZ56_000759 [Daphnia magna]|uniref:Uncharacterized protein n=1 Tax=Daphnia magna TaxID=35525 RepID=A0ABR0A1C7_9CRUS|nr:hypothetical protein OUZ56_000759 [Daphnia magna]
MLIWRTSILGTHQQYTNKDNSNYSIEIQQKLLVNGEWGNFFMQKIGSAQGLSERPDGLR